MKKIAIILAAALFLSCKSEPADPTEPTGPQAEISIEVPQLEFEASGELATGENKLVVTSSGNWRLTGKKTWCTPSAVSGKSGDEVTFVAQENPTEEQRTITYTFFCEDKTVSLTVTQAPARVFEIDQDHWEIPATGSDKVKIRLDTSETAVSVIEESAKGWILPFGTRSITSYLYYKISANDTYAAREGRVTVSYPDAKPRVITIAQKQNNAIKPDKQSYKLAEDATSLTMTVWSNIPFEVRIPDDAAAWLTLRSQPVDSNVWSSQELTFDVVGGMFRATAIQFGAKDGSLTIPIGVQVGEQKVFQVPDKAFREDLIKLGYIAAGEGGYTVTPAGLAANKIDVYKLYAVGGCFSVEGIENFPNITVFDCRFSRIRSADLRQNAKLTVLDQCTPVALESLKVPAGVTTIAFASRMYDHYSGSSSMSRYFSEKFVLEGDGVTTVDVSGNRLKTIDVSGCPALTTLTCTQASGYTLQSITLSESHRGKVTIDFKGAQLIYK